MKPVSAPIERMIASESGATGSVSTRLFHAFVFGKIAQRGALGTRSACAGERTSARSSASSTSRFTELHRGIARAHLVHERGELLARAPRP